MLYIYYIYIYKKSLKKTGYDRPGQNFVYITVFRKNWVMRIAFSHILKGRVKVFGFDLKYDNALSS